MAITVTIQPSNTQGEDCLISSGEPTINYPRQLTAYINSNRAALIKFNLANYLPLKAKLIGMATFEVYKTTATHADTSTSALLTILKRNFVYNEATWNNWKTGSAWAIAGAKNVEDCYGGWGVNADMRGQWGHFINLTGAEWLTYYIPASAFDSSLNQSTQGYGILLTTQAADTGRAFTIAMCGNATAANRPKLTITYEPYHKIYHVSAGLGTEK